ncbi:MAG: CocE/NonD family hydrolase [Clostridia bacterium]|nr:CocE/NonD family hydrolase [Clostridia bacterium]
MESTTLKTKTGFKVLRRIGIGIFLVMFTLVSIVIAAGLMPQKKPTTPAGYKQTQSTYVKMKDGTRIAVRISLPHDLQKNEKVPVILESTRYDTGFQPSFIGNALCNLGILEDDMPPIIKKLLETKHAYILVQARGSGISFGKREIELSNEEIEDYGQIIDWIVQQPWSNGKVGAYGISYMSNSAELTASLKHPALKAAALLYGDFNPISSTTLPGGLFSSKFLKRFRDANAETDANTFKHFLVNGAMPVDEDKDGKLLKEAVAGHKNYDIYESMKKVTYYDDVLSGKYTPNDLAPFNFKKQIQDSGIPLYVRVGWQDAGTVNGAIERYLTYSNGQTLVIGPWNHAGRQLYDPFLESRLTRMEVEKAQADEVIAFLDKYLKADTQNGKASDKDIRYYTYGEGKWKTAKNWPVAGFDNKVFYFNAGGKLKDSKPADATGMDMYKVDFTTSTGVNSRWQTNMGAGPILYPDRAEEDKKLLTYTSEAMESDVEITGVPIVTLNLSSTATDGAFFTYLEDVAPDGKVTYITEGQLRALHRKTTEEDLGHAVVGPKHSFLRKDGQLLKPGENTEMKIGMNATSVLIKKGHKIRIAIAGHDEANFDRIPQNENPILEVQRNSILSSYVELPMQVRK